jgi:aryl-alcohol dehydrogenase-like predicted oxidoreductase
MPYLQLSGLDIPASRLGMGADAVGEDFARVLDRFFERGGNVFDTARVYHSGRCERFFGEWLASRGVRNRAIVISKGAHTPRCLPEALSVDIVQSLEALAVEQIDVYLMHRDNLAVPVGEFVDVLNQHLQTGRIRSYGVSNWSVERLTAANVYAERSGLEPIRMLSNQLSLARMVSEPWPGCLASWDPEQRAYLAATRLPLLAWSTGARGFFADSAAAPFTGASSVLAAWQSDDNFERKRRATVLAHERGASATAVSVAYVLGQAFQTLALIGPKTIEELERSLECLRLRLSAEEMAWLDLRAPERSQPPLSRAP